MDRKSWLLLQWGRRARDAGLTIGAGDPGAKGWLRLVWSQKDLTPLTEPCEKTSPRQAGTWLGGTVHDPDEPLSQEIVVCSLLHSIRHWQLDLLEFFRIHAWYEERGKTSTELPSWENASPKGSAEWVSSTPDTHVLPS
jgi:hypothetical protein